MRVRCSATTTCTARSIPLPAHLYRDPSGRDRRRIFRRAVTFVRRRRCRSGARSHQQRRLLPLPRVGQRLGRPRRRPQADPALPLADQRQDERFHRTLLTEWVHARPYRSRGPVPRLAEIATHLQPSRTRHRARRSPTRQPWPPSFRRTARSPARSPRRARPRRPCGWFGSG